MDIGRFLTSDPKSAMKISEFNPYVYVENNPVNYVDPYGLLPQDIRIGTRDRPIRPPSPPPEQGGPIARGFYPPDFEIYFHIMTGPHCTEPEIDNEEGVIRVWGPDENGECWLVRQGAAVYWCYYTHIEFTIALWLKVQIPADAQEKAREAAESARAKSKAADAVSTVGTGVGLGLSATGVGAPVGAAVGIAAWAIGGLLSGSATGDYEDAMEAMVAAPKS